MHCGTPHICPPHRGRTDASKRQVWSCHLCRYLKTFDGLPLPLGTKTKSFPGPQGPAWPGFLRKVRGILGPRLCPQLLSHRVSAPSHAPPTRGLCTCPSLLFVWLALGHPLDPHLKDGDPLILGKPIYVPAWVSDPSAFSYLYQVPLCYGWIVEALTLGAQNVTVFGGRAFKDVIQSHKVVRVGLIQSDWCPVENRTLGRRHVHTQGEHMRRPREGSPGKPRTEASDETIISLLIP